MMLQRWLVTSRGSLSKSLALREDHNIKDSYTAYLCRLLSPHNFVAVIDIVHLGHLEMSKRCPRAMQDEWNQIVYKQNSKLPCLGFCPQKLEGM